MQEGTGEQHPTPPGGLAGGLVTGLGAPRVGRVTPRALRADL